MDTATTTGKLTLVYGDIAAAYKIVDSVGLSVELVPHVFGANLRPNGAAASTPTAVARVVNDNAARVLKIKDAPRSPRRRGT